jgi:hypothetical protein
VALAVFVLTFGGMGMREEGISCRVGGMRADNFGGFLPEVDYTDTFSILNSCL